MSDLVWKIRQWFRKCVPLVMVGALAFGGYHLYRQGTFRNGLGTLSSWTSKIPYFGSKFSHSGASSRVSHGGSSYSKSKSLARAKGRKHSKRYSKGKRHSRKHHRRHR